MLHERHEGCFITEFVKDETVMSERFTNLEKPFNQIPKYTPVLNRRTHLSEFSYCVSGYHVKNLNSSEQIHTVMTRFPTWHHLISIPPTIQPSGIDSAAVTGMSSVKSMDAGVVSGKQGAYI